MPATKPKQTAVEWLDRWFRDNPEATHEEGNKALQQAKAMEKEQIEDAHIEGQRVFDKYPHTEWTNNQAELYYEQTYGK